MANACRSTPYEIAWRNFYQVWFRLLNDYKKMGGRVTTGSDSGFIYQTYGFGYVNELEMLQEAGFHPLEVIRAATLHGAAALGRDDVGHLRVEGREQQGAVSERGSPSEEHGHRRQQPGDGPGVSHDAVVLVPDAPEDAKKKPREAMFMGLGDAVIPGVLVVSALTFLSGTASVSFWIKTTAVGSNDPRLAPAVTGTGESGSANTDIFWGFLDASGRIGLHVPGTLPTGVQYQSFSGTGWSWLR